MALVPHNLGYARGVGLANFAVQAYRNRHFANYIAGGLRRGYDMVKRAYTGGYYGPAATRRRVEIRRRRYKKQYRSKYRRPFYRRRLSKFRFNKSRRRGRRTLANRYITMRLSRRYNTLLTAAAGTTGNFNNRLITINTPGNRS